MDFIEASEIAQLPAYSITKKWCKLTTDALGQPIAVPVIIAKGNQTNFTKLLCVSALIHGNELNGMPVIQKVFAELDLTKLQGTIIGIPIVNPQGYLLRQRQFNDNIDLNKIMPGIQNGTESETFAYVLFHKLISQSNYLLDLHTASSGRINSHYIRADLTNEIVKKIADLQQAEIILHHPGSKGTLRRAATDNNIPTITLELGNPHIFQRDVIKTAVQGVFNTLRFLEFTTQEIETIHSELPIYCQKSYWIYTDEGGVLEVIPKITTSVIQGQKIAHLKNVFGEIIKEYFAPEAGIVIGKSTDPVAQTGARILHLGILRE